MKIYYTAFIPLLCSVLSNQNYSYAICNPTGPTITYTNGSTMIANHFNNVIVVQGILNIPTPRTVVNCEFQIVPGGQINILGTGLFRADCSTFKGISNLWQKIDLALGARIRLKDCLVRDAYTGLFAYQQFTPTLPVSQVHLRNTDFLQNVTAFDMPSNNNTLLGYLHFKSINCKFRGDGTNLLGQTFKPEHGARFFNLTSVNLHSFIGANVFENVRNSGVWLGTVATVNVRRCIFKDINHLSGIGGTSVALVYDNGLASNIFTGNINITGYGGPGVANYTVENCTAGFIIQNGVSTITQCNMLCGSFGISITSSPNVSHQVSSNRIKCNATYAGGITTLYYGISLFNSQPYGLNTLIANNHIELTPSTTVIGVAWAKGIWVYNLGNNVNPLNLTSNYIDNNYGTEGIDIYKLSNSDISSNYCYINYIPGVVQKGISLIFCDSNHVAVNNIVSNTSAGSNLGISIVSPIGIDNNFSTNTKIYCNELGDAYPFGDLPTGLHVDGYSGQSSVIGNHFYGTTNGVIFGPNNATLNPIPQHSTGNIWNMSLAAGSFFVKHYGTSLPQWNASRFRFWPLDPVSMQPIGIGVDPTILTDLTANFSAIPNVPTFCENVHANYPSPSFAQQMISVADLQEANGIDSSSQFPNTTIFETRKYVYNILDLNAVLRNSNTNYLNYYNTTFNSPIRHFTELKRDIDKIGGSYDPALEFQVLNLQNLTVQLHTLDAAYNNNGDEGYDSIANETWLVERQLLNNQIVYTLQLISNRLSIYKSAKQSTILSLLNLANSLPSNDQFEWNQKTISIIYLKTLAQGNYNFSSDQKEDIIQVSEQCPLAAGEIVYWARGLRRVFNPEHLYYDDVNNCSEQGFASRHANANSKGETNFSYYPNPASNTLTVNFNEDALDVNIIIRDVYGREIYKTQREKVGSEVVVDISSLAVGNYFLSVEESNNGIFVTNKLNIIR